jgi:hypothetical protein
MGNLSANYHDVDTLDAAQCENMFALFERYYDAVSLQQFLQDLESKTIAILLTDSDGTLQGFSTLEVIFFRTDDGPAVAIYSGDTIISHEHWGEQQLSYAWCYFAGQIKQQYPGIPLYWFLIVKGHRTYRYLPAFTRKFYPNYREVTPPKLQKVIDQLATEKFGDAYRPEAGILQFPQSRGHLRPDWVDLNDAVKKKPHVAFFLRTNPGHVRGDELVCLTELCEENMRFVASAAFTEGLNSCQDGLTFDQASPDIATL